jgi:hypothetical protein
MVAKTRVNLDRPANNNKKKLNTKKPFTIHLAARPFAEVDLSLVSHESSKNGTE